MAFTSQVRVLITPPNHPLGFSCGLFGYKQANYYKSEVRKLVHGTNYYSSGWRLKGLTRNPQRERDCRVRVRQKVGYYKDGQKKILTEDKGSKQEVAEVQGMQVSILLN